MFGLATGKKLTQHQTLACIILATQAYIRVVPQLEEVGAHKGQGAGGMLFNLLQVLLRHLPHGGAASLKQRWVVEVPL